MSGGHWDYGNVVVDTAEGLERATHALRFLQAVEHELDWGISGDTCHDCAKLRVLAGIEQLFDDHLYSRAAIALVRDGKQNLCPECQNPKVDNTVIKILKDVGKPRK